MALVKVKVVEGLPLKVDKKKVMEAELDEKVVAEINKQGKTKLEIIKGDK